MKELELLAPAGSLKTLKAVIHAGADAVYLGGSMFGARAYANNFNEEELLEAIRFGHIHGRKIILAVNTLLKEYELGQLYDYLHPYYEAGIRCCHRAGYGRYGVYQNSFSKSSDTYQYPDDHYQCRGSQAFKGTGR